MGQTQGVPEAVEAPAANDVESWQLLLLLSVYGLSVAVCGEIIFRQLIGEDGQFDVGMALQLARNMKCVLIELAAAGRKRCNKTNLHSGSLPSEQGDADVGFPLLALPTCEIEEGFLLHSG